MIWRCSCLRSFILKLAWVRKLVAQGCSCLRSSIHKPAWARKLVGQGRLLPQKLYTKTGMGEKACWPGKAPALEALYTNRHGANSLPGREGSCPRSLFHKPAWVRKLAGQGWHLPQKLYSQSGRVRRACWVGIAPASEAIFTIWQEPVAPPRQETLLPIKPSPHSGRNRTSIRPSSVENAAQKMYTTY